MVAQTWYLFLAILMIPAETVDKIYSTARIEEVVRDYVSLKKRGVNLIGLCPFPGHTEKTPSFTVNPARNICKCFGCGRGGNSVNFIMEVEQCSYPEALKKVAKKYNIEIEEREMTQEEQQRQDNRESMFAVNDWANKWFQEQLWDTQEGQAVALAYFHERGLRDETIRRFQLGFSPEKGNPMTADALRQGFKENYLVNDPDTRIGTGVCGRTPGEGDKPARVYDRFHGRVIFPIHSVSGKTVGFAGRIMVKKDNVGKYVNSPDSLIYSKTRELYGLFLAKHAVIKQQKCYLVEGQMDVISMSQAGIENVVCSGGTALTKEQIHLIHNFTDNVTILYDGDAAGIHAALRGIDMFLDEGMYIKVMLFPDGDDPDSFARKHTAEEFTAYIASHEEDFIHYKARTLLAEAGRDAGRRSEAVQSIIKSIATVKDRIARDIYVKDSADICGLPEKTLRVEVARARSGMAQQWHAEKERAAMLQTEGAPAPAATDMPAPVVNQPQEEVQQPRRQEVWQTKVLTHVNDNFRQIIRLLITMGEKEMVFAAEGGGENHIMTGDYIQQYLAATQIPVDSAYQLLFDEFNANKHTAGFKAEPFFLNHMRPQIAAFAADIVSMESLDTDDTQTQYVINTEVLNVLYDLHMAVVKERLAAFPARIKEAADDSEQVMRLLAEQKQLTALKAQIAGLRHRIN